MVSADLVNLSRLQFAITAMYHFLFVPLTLGLSVLIAIMESVFVMTGRPVWRQMTQYWGLLFGINFVLGVATGITMEFQFGTNWAYYAHYVGDIFGVPLAVEGLMAFFLEATLVGLFFFGWNRMSRLSHLVATWGLAIGSNLSALWILVANGWMQHPVGAAFNPRSMRMELTSFYDVLFNPVAQAKFVHTVSAGYVTGAMFVMAISAWFILKGRNREFARRSMAVAASFGLAASLSVVVLGDESGYTAGQDQKMKIAAIEAMWQTESAPASFTLFGLPNMQDRTTHDAIRVPYLLGLIATRSIDTPVPGILPLVAQNEQRIESGMQAYGALAQLRQNRDDAAAAQRLDAHVQDLGYALLLKRYTPNVTDATPAMIERAAWDTVPNVPALFWSFRLMVGLGMFFILLFGSAFFFCARHMISKVPRWFFRVALFSLPLPWISCELGWFVAENGRQPWTIDGVLPTFLSTSSISMGDISTSLVGFVLFYSLLAVVELYLMVKYVRLGPDQTAPAAEGV